MRVSQNIGAGRHIRPCVAIVLCCGIASVGHATPVACTADQLKVAQPVVAKAQAMLANAVKAIDAGTPEALERLDRWLGIKDSGKAKAVRDRYAAVQTWLAQVTFMCEHASRAGPADVYAYVDVYAPFVVTIGAPFFTTGDSGYSARPGVLIHEASHFLLAGAADDPPTAAGYGTTPALERAKKSPAKAQVNAENLEYFVESLHFGLNP